MKKTVTATLPASIIDMGGVPVRQAFPSRNVEHIDPFLLLHHGDFEVAKGSNALHLGVGPHPLRGFSPVSYVMRGELHHRDSFGNNNVVGAGGIQWLDAARGIIHSERPSARCAKMGEAVEFVQVWINLPKARKWDIPTYRALNADEIPTFSPTAGVRVVVVAGEFMGKRGSIISPMNLVFAIIHLEREAKLSFELPTGKNGGIYVMDGEGRLEGYGLIERYGFYRLSSAGESLSVEASSHLAIMVLQGTPIDEPIAQYGPYVVNTQTEILEAMRDYKQGKMGILIED